MSEPKLIVLDDDPTGTQTVRDLPVITEWTPSRLEWLLAQPGRAGFILTNSRAKGRDQATQQAQEIGARLRSITDRRGQVVQLLVRSDSTLRGHFPYEIEALAQGYGLARPAIVFCPYFRDGGRITRDGIHMLVSGGQEIPVAETQYAKDRTFGYRSSHLVEFVREKSEGRLSAALLSAGDVAIPEADVIAVSVASDEEIQAVIRLVKASPLEFVFHTAASWVSEYIEIAGSTTVPTRELLSPNGTGGLVVVGSYVQNSTDQLAQLLQDGYPHFELGPGEIESDQDRKALSKKLSAAMMAGLTCVLSTFRPATDQSAVGDLSFGETLSAKLCEVVAACPRPRFLITKGGVTSSDTLTQALHVRSAQVLGTALPGVPVWRLDVDSRWPNLPAIIFPGNVGGPTALRQLVAQLVSEM